MSGTDAVLDGALGALAAADVLLVGVDFDGTLAPIVTNSWEAAAPPEALDALDALSRLPRTHVVVLTGRSLAQLGALGPLPPRVTRVGSHGAEWGSGLVEQLSDGQRSSLEEVRRIARTVVDDNPGAALEEKPAGVAVHTRAMPDRELAAGVAPRLLAAIGHVAGVHVLHGKQVVEMSVAHASKGAALDLLRRQLGATATLYVGDDVTDETAFAALRGADGDVGVKVGDGVTAAAYRVADPAAVAALLSRLAALRTAHATP